MKLVRIAVCVGVCLAGSNLAAQSAWFYEIGGAEPVSRPAWTGNNAVPLTANGQLSWNYSCGKFSISNSVNQLLRDVSTAADEYVNLMVANAQAAVASLPAIILQRANPSLYDMMQNGLLRVQAMANAARLDCKAMEETIIASGGGPAAVWDNFKQAARLTDWKAQASLSSGNVVAAQRSVEANAGRNGIAWVPGGRPGDAGGNNQPVIQLSGDVMRAGYRMANGYRAARSVESKAGATPKFAINLLNTWFGSSDSASDWIQRVTGEIYVTTNEAGEKSTKPGFGLNPEVEREANRIYPLFVATIGSNRNMTIDEKLAISPDGTQLTDQLVNSIRELNLPDRNMIVLRLSNEMALQNTIGRALMAMNIYRLGASQPVVMNNESAGNNNDRVLKLLRSFVDDLLYEKRVRTELVAETALMVIDRSNIMRSAPVEDRQLFDEAEPELGTAPK